MPSIRPSIGDDLDSSAAVDLLLRAVGLRATDVHLDPVNDEEYIVRMRIDGRVEEYCRLDIALARRQLHQFKLLAKVDINDPFHPQQGRLKTLDRLPETEVRLTVAPVAGGESLALRISNRGQLCRSIDNLGLVPGDQQKIQQLIGANEGIVLITGPTGSGKTTTVYSLLNALASERRNIVSIEDPVEYKVPYVRQIAVDERHGLTMTAGLKTLLRMDPDVIFVGEIRDAEAAAIAMQAASSGRHVFSTLHTRDVAATITTLRDLKIEDHSLSANLAGAVNQRLIRRLCIDCRTEIAITDAEASAFQAAGLPAPSSIFHSAGCTACGNKGYIGRDGIFEVAHISRRVREAIAAGASEDALRDLLRADGVATLRVAALRKVAEGVTTLNEIETMSWA